MAPPTAQVTEVHAAEELRARWQRREGRSVKAVLATEARRLHRNFLPKSIPKWVLSCVTLHLERKKEENMVVLEEKKKNGR